MPPNTVDQHLAAAVEYIAIAEAGDAVQSALEHAAVEIEAAMNEDPGLTQAEVAKRIGKSQRTVGRLLKALSLRRLEATDFYVNWERGSHGTTAEIRKGAERLLNESPEIVASLNPAAQHRLAAILDSESARRQEEKKRAADEKFRGQLGDELVDGLDYRKHLESTEMILITCRGELRGFVNRLKETDIEETPEAWRTSCLNWIADLEGHLGMARALLAGENWDAFEELLAGGEPDAAHS